MNDMKEWLIQLRYPYTAGVIAVMWLGTAALAMLRAEIPTEALVVLVALATLVVASIGFSSSRR